MPDLSSPPPLTESGDVDHDQTQGGTSGNPHADSAAVGHALGGDAHDASTRAAINALVSDAALESESGAQSKADAAESSAESFAVAEIGNHAAETGGVHGVGAGDSIAAVSDTSPGGAYNQPDGTTFNIPL